MGRSLTLESFVASGGSLVSSAPAKTEFSTRPPEELLTRGKVLVSVDGHRQSAQSSLGRAGSVWPGCAELG